MTEVPTVGDTVATRVRRYRQAQGLSVRALAERCAALGMPQLTVGSLSNIERGQDPAAKRGRREVTVDELMVLALALDVHPIMLMLPYGEGDAVRVAPKREVHPTAAFEWITAGDGARTLFDAPPVIGDPRQFATGSAAPISSYRMINSMLTWAYDRRRHLEAVNRKMEVAGQAHAELLSDFRSLTGRLVDVVPEKEDLAGLEGKVRAIRARQSAADTDLQLIEEHRKKAEDEYSSQLRRLDDAYRHAESLGLKRPPFPADLASDVEMYQPQWDRSDNLVTRFFGALAEVKEKDDPIVEATRLMMTAGDDATETPDAS